MKRKRSRELSKTLMRLRYLETEVDDCKEVCEFSRTEIETQLRQIHKDLNVYDKYLDSDFENLEKANKHSTINTEDVKCEPKKANLPSWAKKLYRKIAIITHPDKVPNGLAKNIKDKFLRIYQESKEFIEKEDYVKLAMVADELSIDLCDIEIKNFSIFAQKERSLMSEIENLKKSLFWAWANSTDEQKELILKDFIKSRGWTSKESQRSRSRKGPGNHPGKSLSQIKNKKLYEKK